MFGSQVGNLSMKYLGIPVSFRCLKNSDLDVNSKFIKKLDAWIGGSSSSGGSITLVDSSLSNLPSYIMMMFLLNKTFMTSLINTYVVFFWYGKKQKRGYFMVKCTRICRSKKKGVLGVKDVRKQNISLLCK
jgi:hypothetical protein